MQFAALIVGTLALGLAAYAFHRARKAQGELDAFATWFLDRYEVADEYPDEFELVEADVSYLAEV